MVSTLSFKLLAEVNGLTKADDSKNIVVNSCVAYFGCTNISGSSFIFHKIPSDKTTEIVAYPCRKETQKLWHIATKLAKPPNLKHARVCCNHSLEEDCYPNYKMQSLVEA